MYRRRLQNRKRTNKGSILALTAILLALVVIPLGLLSAQYGLSLTTRARYQNDVADASLLAAEQLSRIVVNDSHFGFVSMNNQPPIGRATVAGDGEPCPVISINSLLGTIRLDTIIANELNDYDLTALADEDYSYSKNTQDLLQSSLASAVNPENKMKFFDMDGNEITPYAAAKALLERNLQSGNGGRPVQVKNLRISLGWLRERGTTNTPLPQPICQARVCESSEINGNYRACVDVPAFGKSFFFAAVGKAPALVDETMFADADGKRFCSVVKVEADIEDCGFLTTEKNCHWLHVSACAAAAETPQSGPTGSLLVFFPCGPVPSLHCLEDLLRLPCGDNEPARFYQASKGDLPLDAEATPVPASLGPWGQQDITSGRVVSAGLYCWLRAAGTRPRIDSTLIALRREFGLSLKSSNLLYEFDAGGDVVVSSPKAMPLPISVLSDQQVFVETRGQNYSVSCYNNVYNLGTISGGKHAGQPLEGNPINWCDLPYYELGNDYARQEGKGAATGLTVSNRLLVDSDIPGAVLSDEAEFEEGGKEVSASPRKSYYSGGLAVELTISAI